MTGRHFKILCVTLMGLTAGSGYAQLTGNVSVQGEYSPIIVETERLNSFPSAYKFELPAPNLNYEFKGMVSEFKPELLTMGVTGRLTDRPFSKRHGFVDFNIGSWLDTHLHAGGILLADSVNTLTADLKFESSSLYKMKGVPEGYTPVPKKALYDGTLGLSYTRRFDLEDLLKLDFSYRCAYFNYYGTTLPELEMPAWADQLRIPTQTLNDVAFSASYRSTTSLLRGWHAEGSVNYLSYRRLYSPAVFGNTSQGDRETNLKIGGGYTFPINDIQALAIEGDGDFLFYTRKDPEALAIPNNPRTNYGVFSIKPAYRVINDNINFKLGVDLNVSYDAMGSVPGKDFSAIHLSPDVAFNYSTKTFDLFARATGGVTPVTLQLREGFDRYQMPWMLSTLPIYSPIDATVGVTTGPFSGFTATLALRYAIARNVPIGGWYQAFLGAYMPRTSYFDAAVYTEPFSQNVNLHGMNVSLAARYAYGSMVEAAVEAVYTPQNGKTGIFNGFDRPRWILSVSAGVRPVEKLKIELGYDYRGVRNCYSLSGTLDGKTLNAYRMEDINDLHARVTYSLLKNLDIYVQGNNLLNRHAEIIPGLRSEGIVLAGGFYLEF